MEDEKIIDLFWARSENAISETDKKYRNRCLYIANSILNDIQDSEECLNDTYLTAWNLMPPNKPSHLSSFLGKITRRISIDKWRKQNASRWNFLKWKYIR